MGRFFHSTEARSSGLRVGYLGPGELFGSPNEIAFSALG